MRLQTLLQTTLLAAVLALTTSGCGGAADNPDHMKKIEGNAQMYTQRTMWGQANRITTLNFSTGVRIPVNSVVFYEEINSKQISFQYNDMRYYLRNSPRHSKTTMAQMLEQYFSEKKADLSKITKKEREPIKAGKVEVGMSKEAVLVARGIPPKHTTPDLKENTWKYWKFQHGFAQDVILYHFKNNKVASIED